MTTLEAEPAAAASLFGDRIDRARAFTAALAAEGETRGLIGPLELPRLWTRHVLNSAIAAPLFEGHAADIGSGAGLPGIVLAIANGAIYARLTRGQMLDVLSQDYIRTARAKGLSETVVVGKHGLRNLVVPLTTLFAIDIGGLLGGAVITEKVFALGGVGTLLLESVSSLDIQVIVGVTLFAAAVVIIANLLADLSYSILDPRIGARA